MPTNPVWLYLVKGSTCPSGGFHRHNKYKLARLGVSRLWVPQRVRQCALSVLGAKWAESCLACDEGSSGQPCQAHDPVSARTNRLPEANHCINSMSNMPSAAPSKYCDIAQGARASFRRQTSTMARDSQRTPSLIPMGHLFGELPPAVGLAHLRED